LSIENYTNVHFVLVRQNLDRGGRGKFKIQITPSNAMSKMRLHLYKEAGEAGDTGAYIPFAFQGKKAHIAQRADLL
jgi:hypothetical protein